MVDLYQRRGGNLTAPTVNKPIMQNNIVSNISSGIATYMQQKANENFALGSRKLVDDVIKQSYDMNPTDAKKFMEDVESNIVKISNDLQIPDEYKEKMLDVVSSQARGYSAKINQNLERQIENQNKALVIDSFNRGISNQTDFYNGMVDGIIRKDDNSYEANKSAYYSNKKQTDNLLTNALDRNGNQIIKKSNVKNLELDKIQMIKDNLYGLDYNQLVDFDDNSWQNRKRICEQLDIDNKQYDNIDTFIKQRRKLFNEEDERKVQAQNHFDTIMLAKSFDNVKAEDLVKKGLLDKKAMKIYKDYSEKEFNEALITDEDENFMSQMSILKDLVLSKNDGSKDYNKKLLEAGAKVLNNLNMYTKYNGTNEDLNQIFTDMFINAATNQVYADTLATSFDENTALGEMLNSQYSNVLSSIKSTAEKASKSTTPAEKALDAINITRKSIKLLPSAISSTIDALKLKSTTSDAQKYAKKEARQSFMGLLNLANMKLNPFLSNDDKKVIDDEIKKQYEKTNNNLIISKFAGIFPKGDIEKAEKNFKEGKPALLVHNNIVYDFKGFTGKDIILERK